MGRMKSKITACLFSRCFVLTYELHLTFLLEISKFMQVISYSKYLDVVAHP
jgi:hypothetical protein